MTAREEPLESCGSCNADLGPSSTFPWHYPDEDCRAVREPDVAGEAPRRTPTGPGPEPLDGEALC